MKEIPDVVAAVRHAPGYADDGRMSVCSKRIARAIPPEIGINGHKGTWTTVHPLYYDETVNLNTPEKAEN